MYLKAFDSVFDLLVNARCESTNIRDSYFLSTKLDLHVFRRHDVELAINNDVCGEALSRM